MKKFLCLLLLPFLSGCTGLASLAETMNDRQIKSCLYWSGFVGGALNGVQAQVKGVTSTGGVSFDTCLGGKSAD